MDEPFEFNGIPVKTPDTFIPNFATTSTSDSDRTQDLVMNNSPMGTIASYSIGWKDIYKEDAALILQQIVDRPEYSLKHLNPLTAQWEVRAFYTVNIPMGTYKQVNGRDAWESLSFNAIVIRPV